MSENNIPNPLFNVEKIYLKDLSLEVPNAPEVFLEAIEQEVEMRISVTHKKLEDEFYDVTLTATVTTKTDKEKVLFLNEVAQSGIFRLVNIPEADIEPLLEVACPNILFPYAREVVSSTISKAGFPPVILAPFNFDAVYRQKTAGNA